LTLIVCLKGKNGMVLASDSRGTFGDPRGVTAQNDNQKKSYGLSKYVGVLMAGSGELGAMIMNEIATDVKNRNLEGVTPIMNAAREILKRRYDEWFARFSLQAIPNVPTPVRPTLVVIIGGYDLDNTGKPVTQKIYSLNCHLDFAPMLHDYGFALEGVAQYALYLLNRLYAGESVKNLLPLAAYVITETASQDGKVGGPVQMMQITPEEGGKILSSEEINSIITSNSSRSDNLRVSFFKD
jgi:20S proteasome alpha/beta subunit